MPRIFGTSIPDTCPGELLLASVPLPSWPSSLPPQVPYRGQAGDESLGECRHRRVAPGRDLGNPRQSGDLDRHGGIFGGAVTQLAGVVPALIEGILP
jgi:hypothetical protein